MNSYELNKAVAVLKKGGVIIVPTDTVYGFVADAINKKAVEKIYKIKKRPKTKPLPVFVSSIKMAKEVAEINGEQEKRLRKFWPGAYTFVLNRKISSSTNSTAVKFVELYGQDKNTIALRIPKHPFLQKLLKKINRPLVQTSVNLAGQEPLDSAEQIMHTFPFPPKPWRRRGKKLYVDMVIASSKPLAGKSSKIIDLTSEKEVILRK